MGVGDEEEAREMRFDFSMKKQSFNHSLLDIGRAAKTCPHLSLPSPSVFLVTGIPRNSIFISQSPHDSPDMGKL